MGRVPMGSTFGQIQGAGGGGVGGDADTLGGDLPSYYLDTDNHIDGTTNKVYTAVDESKLSGIAAGATANDSDANLLNRANHTGDQLASTISDFTTESQSLIDATFTATVPSNLVVTREYDSITGWPTRGTLPSGTVVIWVNRVDDTAPASGGTGATVDVDIILLNVAA